MDDLTLLVRRLEGINAELQQAPPVVDDLTTVYQYGRKIAHLKRERTRLQMQIELAGVNYWNELFNRTI